jgi:hypothetical protein
LATVFFAGASELATLTNIFTVTAGGVTTPTDPTTITLVVTDPQGGASTYTFAGATITRTGTGAYAKDVSCTIAGEWSYVWTGTGAVPDVNHGSFSVQETNLGHLYVTPQMLRSRLRMSSTDATDDQELHGACYAASRSLEQYCERVFWRGASAESRAFETHDFYDVELGPYNDIASVSALATDQDGDGVFETVWASTDYEMRPVNQSSSEVRPYTAAHSISKMFPYVYSFLGRQNRVQITGIYGWAAVPSPVTEAARIMGAELFKSKDAPFGIASFGEFGAMRVRDNPLVARLLDGYRHSSGYAV